MENSPFFNLRLVRQEGATPDLAALRSRQPAVSQRAWAAAYRLLHEAGHFTARFALAGPEWEEEREDLVMTALGQLVQGVIENSEESYNGLAGWDDVVGVMRAIVRRRVTDFLRQRGRRPLDYVETLPETGLVTSMDEGPFTRTELWEAVAELDPPLPELFQDRFITGWNTTEIAGRRSMNVNTLLTHFARGFRLLKTRLETLSLDKGGRP
jgi:hypothetical protein